MRNDYKFKFSVVMSIYNVEEYVEEAIKSVINQNIGFENNIQLILVNDGSSDNSEEICLKYKEIYPNNIIYLKKENGGLASAKNYGLNYIEGKYVNFFDADDTLPNNVFKNVYKFFEKNAICVDFVCIPLYFFGAVRGIHPKYQYMGKKNRIVNLNTEPYNFVLSGASSFYKNEIFDNFRFDESFLREEDTLLNGSIYKNNPRFGYVCENNVRYNYRKREQKNSLVDTASNNSSDYYNVIRLLDKIINKNKIYEYEQELIIYELRSRLKNINKSLFDTVSDYDEIMNSYAKYIKKLDMNYVLYHSKFCSTLSLKFLFCKLIDEEFSITKYPIEFKKLLGLTYVEILSIDIIKNIITIKVRFQKLLQNGLDIVAFDMQNNVYQPINTQTFSSFNDLKLGEFSIDETNISTFNFDIKKTSVIKFILFDKNSNTFMPFYQAKCSNSLRLSSTLKKFKYKDYVLEFNGRIIKIKRTSTNKMFLLKERLKDIRTIKKQTKKISLLRLLTRTRKKYILINDRLQQGNDNGEALFKYINLQEPNLAKITYFVLSKKCKDYKRIKKIGKVVNAYSIFHKFLFLNAKYIFSSHTMPEYYNAFLGIEKQNYKDLFNYKFIWLQHGVTMNDISKAANKYRKGIDYIVAATYDEYSEFQLEKYGYDKNDIILTGFSRYDLLKNDIKNFILIMPTWRRGFGDSKDFDKNFVNSDYYKSWTQFLNDKKLFDMCKKNNLKIKFILHPEMSKYKDEFYKFENDIINIYKSSDINYTNEFNSSILMITDYSSVFFDFAYLKKPLIYYQFDQEFFWGKHYNKGYFDFEKNGFGDVIIEKNTLVDKIEYYIKNNFKIEKKYKDRIKNTFKYNDCNNSKRIVDKIIYNTIDN